MAYGEDVYKVVLDDSQIRRVAKQVAREFDSIGGSATEAGNKVDSAFTGMGNNIKKTFGDVTSSVLGGFKSIAAGAVGFTAVMEAGSFVRNMYQQIGEFSKSMQEVSTISEEVTNDMAGFKKEILELTTRVPIGANEAAKALYQIISAGQQGSDAMHVLEVSAKAAIGGVTDTATAADTITTILNAYKMDASQAEAVSDKLFTTVRLGKTTMAELGASIANVAPTAAAYGVSIDEVLSAIATLTKQGTATAVATTQIRSAILSATNSLGDGAFKTRSFAEALDEVAKKAKGSETALKDDLGRVEAMNAVLGLTGKNAAGAAEDLAAMQNATGAAEDAFRKMSETASAQITILQNHLVELFTPVAGGLKNATAEIARSLNLAFESGAMERFGNVLKGLVITYGAYKAAVILTTALEAARATGIGALTAKEAIHYGWLVATEKAQKLLNATMLKNPYIAAATALGALIAVLIAYNKNADDTKKIQGELDSITRKANERLVDKKTKIEELKEAAESEKLTLDERKKAIDKLNAIIPNYNAHLDDTTGKYIANKTALDDYLASLVRQYEIEGARAKLQEIGDKKSDLALQRDEIQRQIDDEQKLIDKMRERQGIQTSGGGVPAAGYYQAMGDASRMNQLKNNLEDINEQLRAQDRLVEAIKGHYGDDLLKSAVQDAENAANGNGGGGGNGGGRLTAEEAERRRRQAQQLADQLLAIQRKNEAAEIELLEDGIEKRRRMRELDYNNQMDALDRQERSWREAQGGSLTEKQMRALETARRLAADKQAQEVAEDYRNMLEQYQGYIDQRKAIQDRYEKERKNLAAAGGNKAAQDELDYQEKEALANIDNQFARREQAFEQWADGIVDISLEKLNMMLLQATISLERMERENPANPELATARAKVNALREQIGKGGKKATDDKNLSPSEKALKKWKDLQRVLNDGIRGFQDLGAAVGGVAGEFIDAAGTIAANTISIIDGIEQLVNGTTKAIEGTAEAASQSISSVEKASVILTIISAALQIAQKIAGLFAADMSSYNNMKDNYQALTEIWDELIEKKKEYISISYATESAAAAREANALVDEEIDAARRLAREYAAAGSGAFSHSKGYLMNAAIGGAEFDRVSQAVGLQIRSVTDLISLTGEQLQLVKETSPYLWAQLQEDFRGYLQDIIDAEGTLEDIENALKENLTSTTFDDVKSNFEDNLMDMEADSADFADNVAEMFTRAMLSQQMLKKYNAQLEAWYNKFASDMNDGLLNDAEMDALRGEYQQIVDEALAERNRIAAITGYDASRNTQEASSAFTGMSQETADELNGRFTAIQVAAESVRGHVAEMNQSVSAILNLGVIGVGHLEDISRNTHQLYAIADRLGEIERNTRNI